MRTWLRNKLFAFVDRILASHDGRDMLLSTLRGHIGDHTTRDVLLCTSAHQPYPDLPTVISPSAEYDGTVFITGRFRSGSTLLWNIFRHVPGCTAYYEPLNERRWFDAASRGEHTDKSHKRVDNYWREYDGLGELAQFYSEDWIRRDLFMSKTFWEPNLQRYLELLIERAAGRAVLQFNRVDFRLPWLRAAFPRAKIIHLYRHPRDQWLSTLHGTHFPLDGSTVDFAAFDKFYLLMWARDLKHHFPILCERHFSHPYQLYYVIWRLSYLFGRTYSDLSIAFEHLIQSPRQTLETLFAVLDIPVQDLQPFLDVIVQPRLQRWQEYAPSNWFSAHEVECERMLAEFFGRSDQNAIATDCSSYQWESQMNCDDTPVAQHQVLHTAAGRNTASQI